MFKISKGPVHTADGSLARIYETSGSDPEFPIVGEIRNKYGKWFLAKWTAAGVFYNLCPYYNLVAPGTPRIERFQPQFWNAEFLRLF